MSSNRSPRYPSIDLGDAIGKIEKVFNKEGRAPFSKEVAAGHCGYSSWNGSSAKAVSALKKYGFLRDDNAGFRLTDDAITIIANTDVPNSQERKDAIKRAALKVELFAGLLSTFGPTPSETNLTAQLITKGFSKDGAAKAARAYLATMELVARESDGKIEIEADGTNAEQRQDGVKAEEPQKQPPPAPPAQPTGGFQMVEGERLLADGLLSKSSKFRVLVSGQIGVKEIERLIKKLEFDKEILADPDDNEEEFDNYD